MNKYAVISSAVPQVCAALEQFGFKLIYTDCVDEFISYEKYHADMQCLVDKTNVFVLQECDNIAKRIKELGFNAIHTKNKVHGKYPKNILLNVKVVGRYVIGKIDAVDNSVLEYFRNLEYSFIDVNQGYSGCSCTKVSENAVITADNSIFNILKYTDIDVLKITPGHIRLSGAQEGTYGFIGGASVLIDENNLLFFGNIRMHPDYERIKDFCLSHTVSIHSIENIELTDIGGACLLIN